MTNNKPKRTEVSYAPCPPEEFAGRFQERDRLKEILARTKDRGQVVMISGARGSGKSSFLDWAEYEIRDNPDGFNSPAIKKIFRDVQGIVFDTYKELTIDLKRYQKFGLVRKYIAKFNRPIRIFIQSLKKAPIPGIPWKTAVDLGLDVASEMMSSKSPEYRQLFSALLKILNNLSARFIKKNRFLSILIDDIQWSSAPDLQLLKELIQSLPSNIAIIITFRLETGNKEKYDDLKNELNRFWYEELLLEIMKTEEIEELASKRYDVTLESTTLKYLREYIGDPLCLIGCFNRLKKDNLDPTLAAFKKIKPEAVEAEDCIYSALDQIWKDRVDSLCILRPPMQLNLIASMLDIEKSNIKQLKNEFDHSIVFTKIDKESYDFVHPSPREYRRQELPEDTKIECHSKAAVCMEKLKDKLPDKWAVDLSLAEHLFYAQEYEKALDLNLQLGDKLYDLFDFDSALQLTERAQICAEETENNEKLADALNWKGIILQFMFRFPEALAAYNQGLKISREIDDLSREAKTLHQMGMIYTDMNRFAEALEACNQSLEISRAIDDRSVAASTFHQIGIVYQKTNRFDKSLESYNRSLAIKREIGHRSGEATTLHQIGMVYANTNGFDEALKAYNKSLEIVREIGNRSGEATTLHQIGMVYQFTTRFEEAINSFKKSLKIVSEIGNRSGEAMTLHQIGIVYQNTNKFEEALDTYTQSLTIERKIGDRAGEATALHQIGMVYQLTNRFEEALELYNQSLKIKKEIGDRALESTTLQQIGMVYQITSRFEESLEFHKQSLKIAQDLGNLSVEAIISAVIATIYRSKENYTKALDYFNNALKIVKETGKKSIENAIINDIKATKEMMQKQKKK